jgi:hypothetical protein
MAATKSFRGYMPADVVTIRIESADGQRGVDVALARSVPGSVILDFMSKSKTDDPGSMATAVESALKALIDTESWDKFSAFIAVPENGISIGILSEIAGYAVEMVSGDRPPGQPLPSTGSS